MGDACKQLHAPVSADCLCSFHTSPKVVHLPVAIVPLPHCLPVSGPSANLESGGILPVVPDFDDDKVGWSSQSVPA